MIKLFASASWANPVRGLSGGAGGVKDAHGIGDAPKQTARPVGEMRTAVVIGGGILLGALIGLPRFRDVLRERQGSPAKSEFASRVPHIASDDVAISDGPIVAHLNDSPGEPLHESRFAEKIDWVHTISQLPTEDYQLESAHRIARRDY